MSTSAIPTDPTRILALTLHPRYTGFAALDRNGLMPDGFGITSMRRFHTKAEQARFLVILLQRAIVRFHPASVVLAVPPSGRRRERWLTHVAMEYLVRAGPAVIWRSFAEARAGLLAAHERTIYRPLLHLLTWRYFPELARYRDIGSVSRRYWRPAWDALVLAVHDLGLLFPRILAALARSESGAPSPV